MESRLNLNMELVEKARASASKVADDVQEFIDAHTTVTVERAVCRLLGIDGVNDVDVPLPNVVVDHLHEKGILPGGAAFYVGNAMAEYGIDPQAVAEKVAAGEIDLADVKRAAYTNCLNRGIKGLLADIDEALAKLPKHNTSWTKIEFYRACKIALNAVIKYAHSYADLLEKTAAETDDPKMKAELLETAEELVELFVGKCLCFVRFQGNIVVGKTFAFQIFA